MKVSIIEDKQITDNETCMGCQWLIDRREYKAKSFICLLFNRCLPDSLEYCDECKKARAGELIKVF